MRRYLIPRQRRRAPAEPYRSAAVTAAVTVVLRMIIGLAARIHVTSMPDPLSSTNGRLIVANHRSLLDLAIGLIIFRKWGIAPYIFIREDYFAVPIVGSLLRAVGGIPAGPVHGTSAFRAGLRILRQGGTIVIMPEGRIVRGQDLRSVGRLMPGAAHLAAAAGSAVLVAGLVNTDVAWPPGSAMPRLYLRRSRRTDIVFTAEWLAVEQGASRDHVQGAIERTLRSILDRLGASDEDDSATGR